MDSLPMVISGYCRLGVVFDFDKLVLECEPKFKGLQDKGKNAIFDYLRYTLNSSEMLKSLHNTHYQQCIV
jgi:hypothetical protein